MTTTQIPVPMDAARVCRAIAKIGYSPSAALMDIIDNSITANATRVQVEIDVDLNGTKTFASKNNVIAYRVIDNGDGMDDEQILNALKLGARADYDSNSLSKYGMGLKSAGFSLGTKIQIISKKDGAFSSVNYVDMDEISAAGEYVVSRREFSEEDAKRYGAKLADSDSGTIIEITGCANINQDSAKKTITKLTERLGVVYYEFLRRQDDPLTITISCPNIDTPDVRVAPFDILFSDLAVSSFDPDSYDFKSPCQVFKGEIKLSESEDQSPIELEMVLFPGAIVARYAGFSDEEKAQISGYQLKRENKGFFIYRNDRLITWGDDFDNKVDKNDVNFRARMVINTAHDDTLHVDVSKQRLAIPEDIEERIKRLTTQPLREAELIRKMCTQLVESKSGDEGSTFNERNQDLVEEDPDEPTGEKSTTTKTRKAKLVSKTEEVLEKEGEEKPAQDDVVEQIPVFQKVRYSDKVSSVSVWDANTDPVEGTFVRINKNHSFYSTVLSRLNEGDKARQAMEAFLWACAAAENMTYRNLADVDEQVILKVLTRFKKLLAINLDTWCGSNQDLYDND